MIRVITVTAIILLVVASVQASSIFCDVRYAKVNSALLTPDHRDYELKVDASMMATRMPQGLIGRAWFMMQPLEGYEWFGGAGYFVNLIKPNGRVAALIGIGDTNSRTEELSSYWQGGLSLELRPWYFFFNSTVWHRHLNHPDRKADQVIIEPLEAGFQLYGWRLGATARGCYTYQGVEIEEPGWKDLKVGPMVLCPYGRITVRVYIPVEGESPTGTEVQVGMAFM